MCHVMQSHKSQLFLRKRSSENVLEMSVGFMSREFVKRRYRGYVVCLGTLGYRVILMVWRIQLQCHRPFFPLAPRCNVTGLNIRTGVQLGDHAHILTSLTLDHFRSTEFHHIRGSSHYLCRVIPYFSEVRTEQSCKRNSFAFHLALL